MNKFWCDKCGDEIKYGIRFDDDEVYPKFCRIEVRGYTGEGIAFPMENYDLCNSCYSKLIKFLEEN